MSTTHLTRHQTSVSVSVRSALLSLSGRRVGVVSLSPALRKTMLSGTHYKMFVILQT